MTTTSGNINSTTMVVQAFLNMTQDITQGVISQQSVDIDCTKNTKACNQCIETAKLYKLADNDDYSAICPACYCDLENVKMNNYITIDFNAFEKSQTSDAFKTQIQNSLTQQAANSGQTLFNTGDGLKALSDTSETMYTEMKALSDQNILQQLKDFQVIGINNPNSSVINVDMDLTVNFLSNIIQQTKSTASVLTEYESTIVQLTTQVTENSITVVITWIVTLFVIAIVVAFFIFGISIIMDVFMLYAST